MANLLRKLQKEKPDQARPILLETQKNKATITNFTLYNHKQVKQISECDIEITMITFSLVIFL